MDLKSVILAHLLEAHILFTVFIVLQIENYKILLYLLYPPIVKLISLLGRCTSKEQDFIYLHY